MSKEFAVRVLSGDACPIGICPGRYCLESYDYPHQSTTDASVCSCDIYEAREPVADLDYRTEPGC